MKYAMNTQNNKIYQIIEQTDDSITLFIDGQKKTIKQASFKRWYRVLSENLTVQTKQKHYVKNDKPLWDAVIIDNKLAIRDANRNTIIICSLSETKTCVVVKQVSINAKRYFTDFNRARKHILNNQDIRTIQSIGSTFDKWLALKTK